MTETGRGLFVDIDPDDPFEVVELVVRTDLDEQLKIGQLTAYPGRYELERVNESESDPEPDADPLFTVQKNHAEEIVRFTPTADGLKVLGGLEHGEERVRTIDWGTLQNWINYYEAE